MTARIIDGRALAKIRRDAIRKEIEEKNIFPHLAIILANDNPASAIYVKRKQEACKEVGIACSLYTMPKDCEENDVLSMIDSLNKDSAISGLFLQLPLPDHLDPIRIVQAIDPAKDVDGLTYSNLGRVMVGIPHLTPCTPLGVMDMFQHENIKLEGKHVVIIGRSLLLGVPLGQLLLQADCTVTHCHLQTRNLPDLTRQADILVVAAGDPHLVKRDWVKPGAVVIDVGINRLEDGTITGDVDYENVKEVASAITPVPGGVGPMTVASLLRNTVDAAS